MELHPKVTVDYTDGLRDVRDFDYHQRRSVHLRLTRDADGAGHVVQAWGTAFPDDGGGGFRGHVDHPPATIESGVAVLRAAWQRQVIECREHNPDGRSVFPFVDNWRLTTPADTDRLDRIGLELARAGYTLFKLLFVNRDPGMQEIVGYLRRALCADGQVITVESDDLFVPWGMLYTPPEGDAGSLWSTTPTWSFDGFWGYRHLVEHTFSRVPGFDSRITVAGPRAVVGLNVDERVDQEYPPTAYVKPVIDFFASRADVVVRRKKAELATALQDGAFGDHITCFGCHGEVSGDEGQVGQPYLVLSDDERIYGAELAGWMSDASLPTRPVVYAGACQGGQLSSHFYPAFGHHMLRHGARCLVGPQIDLPRAFAREYTTQLFTQFLEPGGRLGAIMRALARTFLAEHGNPLGLAFSLYRGIDVHLWPEE